MRSMLFLLFLSLSLGAQAHPLVEAAGRGDVGAVQALLESGVDIDSTDSEGETALHEACDEGHLDVLDYLLKQGARLHMKDQEGEDALHECVEEALKKGRWTLLDRLLQEPRLDLNSQDGQGRTVLMMLAQAGHAPYVERILRLGAAVGIFDRNGRTALDHASDPAVQELLRRSGAR